MRTSGRSLYLRVWAFGSFMSFSGCALVNPHVSWSPPDRFQPTQITLDYAIQYADNAKKAYKIALGDHSRLTSMLGLGLIPLSAAALGLGITGGSTTAITALGLTGVAGYGTGTWLYSKPYQRAYVTGYNATTCAVQAVLPLVYVKRNEAQITQTVNELNTAITAVENSIGAVRAQLVKIGDKPPSTLQQLVTAAEGQLKMSGQILDAAYDTRSKVIKMMHEADVAGVNLKEAVDRIAGQVSALLIETGSDMQALASIVGGLAQSYGQFVRVPEGVRPPVPQTPQAQVDVTDKTLQNQMQALAEALGPLYTHTSTLQGVVRRIGDMVNAVTTSKPLEVLEACGVSPEEIVVPITIEPSALIEFTAGTASTAGRIIRGGAAPYAVDLQGDAVDGLTVRQTEPFGPAFVVQSAAKIPAGDYTISVSDRAGQRQFVQVSVKSPTGAAGSAGTTTSSLDTKTQALGELATQLRGEDFEVPNHNVFVKITAAKVEGEQLVVKVVMRPKSGGTLTQDQINTIPKDAIVTEILNRKVVKNVGITKKEDFRVEFEKAP